jgi:integrase
MSRGRDGLYRREKGILAFRYKDKDGEWREKYTGAKDRSQAREFRNRFFEELKKHSVPTEMARWRLEETEEWWIEFRQPRISPSTQSSERYRLKHFARILGNKRLREIDSRDLDRYVSRRLKEGIGAWSINKEVLLWSLILRKAKLWSRLRDDYKPLRTRVSDIGRALSREQLLHLSRVARLKESWECAYYGFVLAANTGLRGGEIKKLKIGALDVARKRLVIRRKDTKSDAGARYIELNSSAAEAASRLLMRAKLLGSEKPEQFLLPKNLSRVKYGQEKGKLGYDPMQHQGYWDTAWHSLTAAVECPNCGTLQAPGKVCQDKSCLNDIHTIKSPLSGLRFHDLRHTFITHMVEQGVPLGVIQTFVGHISARMVRHYTHISSGAARDAVDRLDTNLTILRETKNPAQPAEGFDRPTAQVIH